MCPEWFGHRLPLATLFELAVRMRTQRSLELHERLALGGDHGVEVHVVPGVSTSVRVLCSIHN